MKKLHALLMMLFVAIVMVGCGGDNGGLVLPDNPNPVNPNPTPDNPSEFPLISTDPAFVTEAMTEDVTVILNTASTAADGFTGELYAHTGVLTTDSATTGDWKHVLAEWGTNIPECKLQRVDDNLWLPPFTIFLLVFNNFCCDFDALFVCDIILFDKLFQCTSVHSVPNGTAFILKLLLPSFCLCLVIRIAVIPMNSVEILLYCIFHFTTSTSSSLSKISVPCVVLCTRYGS